MARPRDREVRSVGWDQRPAPAETGLAGAGRSRWPSGVLREAQVQAAVARVEPAAGDDLAPGEEVHALGAVGVHFFTRGKVITSRWLDPSHGGLNLGFPQNA